MKAWRKCGAIVAVAALGLVGAFPEQSVAAQWKKVKSAETKTYALKGFTEVCNVLQGVVEVSQGSTFSVQGESLYEGLLDDITVEVRKDVLVVDASNAVLKEMSSLRNFPLFTLRVTLPKLTKLRLAGSGDIRVVTDVETDNLSVVLTGSGEVKAKNLISNGLVEMVLAGSGEIEVGSVRSGEMAVKLTGSGDVEVGDAVVNGGTQVVLGGSGDLKVGNVSCKSAEVSLTGSGDVDVKDVQASRSVRVQCVGSGDMKFGEVRSNKLGIQVTGSGEIELASATVESVDAKLTSSGSISIGGGESSACDVSVTGSGDIAFQKHRAKNARVSVSGSGDVAMYVTEELRLGGTTNMSSLTIDGRPRLVFEGRKGSNR